MKTLRTPDAQFESLPGFAFEPHYPRDPGPRRRAARVRFLDEPGRAGWSGGPTLLLHGEPSWTYLYRTMIPVLTEAGIRVGRPRPGRLRSLATSPPAGPTTPTPDTSSGCASLLFDGARPVRRHHGGSGLGAASSGSGWSGEHPERFARVVAANTFLPIGNTAAGAGLPAVADLLAGGRDLPDRVHHQLGLHLRAARRRSWRPRRAVPRRDLRGGRPPVPDPGAGGDPGRSGVGRQSGGLEGARALSTGPASPPSATGDPITAGSDVPLAGADPGRSRPGPSSPQPWAQRSPRKLLPLKLTPSSLPHLVE